MLGPVSIDLKGEPANQLPVSSGRHRALHHFSTSGCTVLDLTFTQKRFLLRAFDGRLERLSERLAQRLA